MTVLVCSIYNLNLFETKKSFKLIKAKSESLGFVYNSFVV